MSQNTIQLNTHWHAEVIKSSSSRSFLKLSGTALLERIQRFGFCRKTNSRQDPKSAFEQVPLPLGNDALS